MKPHSQLATTLPVCTADDMTAERQKPQFLCQLKNISKANLLLRKCGTGTEPQNTMASISQNAKSQIHNSLPLKMVLIGPMMVIKTQPTYLEHEYMHTCRETDFYKLVPGLNKKNGFRVRKKKIILRG